MRRGLILAGIWALAAYLLWHLLIKPFSGNKVKIPSAEEIEEAARRFRERLDTDERFRAVLDHPLTQNWFPKRS